MGFPGGSDNKESAYNVGRLGSIPWRRKWQPIPVFLPGEFNGQRSLVSYSPWSHKVSDTTERLTLSLPENRERRKRKKKKTDLRTYSLIRW